MNSETFKRSVNRSGLDELKEAGLRFKLRPVLARHVKAARHRSEGRGQRTTRGVFKRLTGSEGGLFANNSRAMNFLGVTRPIYDRPMSIQKLDGCIANVRNLNRVEEEPATRLRIAVLRRIVRSNPNADSGGFRLGGCFEQIAFGHGWNSSRHSILEPKAGIDELSSDRCR